MEPVDATLHFLELSPTVWPLLTYCSKWSFSGRLRSPKIDSFGDPKWCHLRLGSRLGSRLPGLGSRLGYRVPGKVSWVEERRGKGGIREERSGEQRR